VSEKISAFLENFSGEYAKVLLDIGGEKAGAKQQVVAGDRGNRLYGGSGYRSFQNQ
jgi:hypothetical protein